MFGNGRRAALARAYPGITFRPHTRGLLARFMRAPAECVHLETEQSWMGALLPDTAFLKGKPHAQRRPARPEVSLCLACMTQVLEPELRAFPGLAIAIEPDPAAVTQYFFVAREHFEAAYLQKDVAAALAGRLDALRGKSCTAERCTRAAKWLWFTRREVAGLEESALIAAAPGVSLCAHHGAARMIECLGSITNANLEYVNAPYSEAGAYVWF